MKTSLYTVLCTVVRLGAMLMAVNLVVAAPVWLSQVNSNEVGGAQWMAMVGFSVGTLILAFLLWLFPGLLAKPASGSSAHQVFESSLDAEQWLTVALAVLGTWTAVTALTAFVRDGLTLWLYFSPDTVAPAEARRLVAVKLLPSIAQLVLGIVIALRARGLTGLFYRLRHARPGSSLPSSDEGAQ